MATFHSDPFAGLPAPSDFELAAMDARPRRYDFNGATKLLNINSDRERFHRWCGRMINLSFAYDEGTWRIYYRAFLMCDDTRECQIRDEDARDQANTYADALV